MSNHEVAAEFNQELLDAQNYYQGEKRNVEVLSDISIINNHTQGIHQIDFKTVDYKEDQSVERHWVAKIEYIVSPESLTKETVLENPLGVFVTAYTKSPKKHYQESTNANNHR
jgi:type IV secretory pathway component VirB8